MTHIDPFQREVIEGLANLNAHMSRMEDLAKRVTALEVFQARVLAGVAILSALAGACVDYIRQKIFG